VPIGGDVEQRCGRIGIDHVDLQVGHHLLHGP
jgi:hypothetical protein